MKSLAIPLAALVSYTAHADDRAALETLAGTWVSPAVEVWPGGYGVREFVFADGRWSLTFVHALDPAMTQRTFQFRAGGTYRLQAPSEAVPGAWRTIFGEEWKRLTLLTSSPEVARAMGIDSCGLTVNLEADIGAAGCAMWRSVAECGEDHDLLALSAEGLRFGVRPADNDMCAADRTPTALLPAVVAR